MLRQFKEYQPDLPGCILIIAVWGLSLALTSDAVLAIFPSFSTDLASSLGAILSTTILVYIFFRLRSIPISRLFSPSFANPPIVTRYVLLLVFPISICEFITSSFVVDVVQSLETGYFPDFVPLGRRVAIDQLPYALLSSLIAAPLCEEIVFRGIVLRGLLHHRGPLYAIVVSAIIFGIMHILTDNALYASFGGIVTGWLYWRTRSLWPAIFAHFSNNLLAITTGFVPGSDPQWFFYLLLILSIIVLPFLILRVHQLTNS